MAPEGPAASGRLFVRTMRAAGFMRMAAVTAALIACAAAVEADADAPGDGAGDVRAHVAAILSLKADAAYGEYLAGDCAACHRRTGAGAGIPAIAGKPAGHIVTALVEYRLGRRDNEVMTIRAARLGDEEIAALAAHFSAQTP